MRSLQQFILEKYNDYRVKNLEVPYIVNPKNDYIIFKIPEIWSEDDFLIYLQDRYLNDMPGGEDYAEDFFGKNTDNIFDYVIFVIFSTTINVCVCFYFNTLRAC